MKERPLLFSAPMVRALLTGTKTQTRRVCKPAEAAGLSCIVEVPDPQEHGQIYNGSHFGDEEGGVQFASPYGGIGDRLWVRESFAHVYRDNAKPNARSPEDVAYRADGMTLDQDVYGTWKPSIHMPRWASRITLVISSVRVERLQGISEADAQAEGVRQMRDASGCWVGREGPGKLVTPWPSAREAFADVWNVLNGPRAWAANPWVWVLSFKRIEREAPA